MSKFSKRLSFLPACVLLALFLFATTTTSSPFYRSHRSFWYHLSACKGIARKMCIRLSSYCHPRILKRSIDNTDDEPTVLEEKQIRTKRAVRRRRFRFNCQYCETRCWN